MKRRAGAAEARKDATLKARQADHDADWFPSWAPYVVFALLALFLFREFIVSQGLLFGTDVAALGYFARHWYAEMVRSGTFPLWNPLIFGGLPFVDAMHGDIFYPTTLLSFIMPVHRAMGWKIVVHVFLAGVFTYAWLRHLKVSRDIATWGGIAYMLSPVLVSLVYPGHDGKLFVTALTPLALWISDWAITRGGLRRFATLALVVALLIFTAHMQLAYYATWAALALAVFRLAQQRQDGRPALKLAARFGAFALAGVAGAVAIGALQIWAPLRYLTTYSQRVEKTTEAEEARGYAYSTSWSLHPEEAFSLVVPEFIGSNLQTDEGPTNTYWGRNPFKLNHEYGGLIPLLLLPVALLVRGRRSEVWLLAGLAAASLIYALGATTPLFRLFYWLVPGVKLFRAPSSIMFIFATAVITAAALGLDTARQSGEGKEPDRTTRKVTLYLAGAAGLLLITALLASTGALTELWVALLYRDIDPAKTAALQANLPNIQRGLWLSLLLVGLLAGGWELWRRGKLTKRALIAVLIGLSVIDLLRVDPQFIRVIDPAQIYPRDDTTEFLLARQQEEEPFRVFPLPNAPYQMNHFAFFGLEEMTGHHGNEVGRYRDLVAVERLAAHTFRLFRLLNVRYLVSGVPLQSNGLREVYRGRRAIVYELQGATPRAYLVSSYESVPDSLALEHLVSSAFDPTTSVILEPGGSAQVDPTANGGVRWTEDGANRAVLEVETTGPALLVISDNYYPAWRATVDGNTTRVLRANYSLRAIPLPGSGRHEVRLEYRSRFLQLAFVTTLGSVGLVAVLIAISLLKERRAGEGTQAGKEAV